MRPPAPIKAARRRHQPLAQAEVNKLDVGRDTELLLDGIVVVGDGLRAQVESFRIRCRLRIEKETQDLELARRQRRKCRFVAADAR